MKTVAFIGAGSFGTALSTIVAGKGCRVNIYGRNADHLRNMELARENRDYLPGVRLEGDYHYAPVRGWCLAAWMLGTAYAVTDEFHQLFVPDRACSLIDMGIDSAGVACGVLIYFIFKWRKTREMNYGF